MKDLGVELFNSKRGSGNGVIEFCLDDRDSLDNRLDGCVVKVLDGNIFVLARGCVCFVDCTIVPFKIEVEDWCAMGSATRAGARVMYGLSG